MLLLTRKIGQSIMIGDDIVVRISAITGGQVKIGIEAPSNVAINREEIYEKLQKQGETFITKGYKNEN